MTRFEISPATMEPATVEVTTRATITRLEAIEPTWAERSRSVEISPGQVRWVRDALTGELPLSAGERADIEASGIALEEVEPGRCVREFHVPPVVAERRHQVLLQEPAQIYRVTDAKLRKETQTVTLVPEHRRLIEVPPVIREQRSRLRVNFDSSALPSTDTSSPVAYQSVDQPAVETPAMITWVTEAARTVEVPIRRVETAAIATPVQVPARFETVTETHVEIEPRLVWRLTGGLPQDPPQEALPSTATHTGRMACLRRIPAVRHRYEFSELVSPAEVRSRVEPASSKSFDVKVSAVEAQAVPRTIPAQTQTRRVTVDLPQPATGPLPVVCKTDVGRSLVRQVQSALQVAGFDPGEVDGLSGPATLNALAQYEVAMNLTVTGRFALPTLQRLGVKASMASGD